MKYMSDSNKMTRISSKINQAKREAFYIIIWKFKVTRLTFHIGESTTLEYS